MSDGSFDGPVPTYSSSRRTITEQQVHLDTQCEDVTLADLRLVVAAAEAHNLPDDALFDLRRLDLRCVLTVNHKTQTQQDATTAVTP